LVAEPVENRPADRAAAYYLSGMPRLARVARLLISLSAFGASGCMPSDPGPPARSLAADSVFTDLFTLGARLRLRDADARLTPRGETLMGDTAIAIQGEAILLPTGRPVRSFSAYARHERDMACDPAYSGPDALLILDDDGIEVPCRDTAFAWVPGYPYRVSVPAAYVEGRGFWIRAGDLPFARGRLIVLFEYAPGGSDEPE
jgi:hypothetical protein